MADWYDQYLSRVREFEPLDDTWFGPALAAARAGDNAARDAILGASLQLVVDVVPEFQGRGSQGLGDLIEEGNRALADAFADFPGFDAQDYRTHVKSAVKAALDRLLGREGVA